MSRQASGSPNVRYIATVRGSQEVTLIARSDLVYWRDALDAIGLEPREYEGHARLLLTAVQSHWVGVTFREFTVAVSLAGKQQDDWFLAAAFNTSPLFAWCERTFFQTPYERNRVDVQVGSTSTMSLGGGAIEATCQLGERPQGYSCWEGKLHLPARQGKPGGWFAARIEGETAVRPFFEGDLFQIDASRLPRSLAMLIEAGCEPLEWHLRASAKHARSKTFVRGCD